MGIRSYGDNYEMLGGQHVARPDKSVEQSLAMMRRGPRNSIISAST